MFHGGQSLRGKKNGYLPQTNWFSAMYYPHVLNSQHPLLILYRVLCQLDRMDPKEIDILTALLLAQQPQTHKSMESAGAISTDTAVQKHFYMHGSHDPTAGAHAQKVS